MKNVVLVSLASVVLSAASSVSFASTYCGEVGSYQGNLNTCVGGPGKFCPDFYAVGTIYTLTSPLLRHSKEIFNIDSASAMVRAEIANLVGKEVCLEATEDADYDKLNVTSIEERK